MKKPLNVALVGCGYWGINYLRVLLDLPEANLQIVCDTGNHRLDEIKSRFKGVNVTNNLAEITHNKEIDAVVIATPSATHFEVAKELIASGKSLLIEKPMTIKAEDSRVLVEMAKDCNVKLMVGHIFLFNPGIEAIKNYIDGGQVGRLYYMYARRTNLGPIRNDVNVVWDLATHDVSIFNYILGCPPDWVSAVGNSVLSESREDVGFVTLHYPKNVIAHIHVSWLDPNKVRELVLVGSQQRIAFNDLSIEDRVRVFEKGVAASHLQTEGFGEHQLSIRDGNIISPNIPIREPLKAQILHFISAVQENSHPLSDGQNGYDVVRTMEAINLSMQQSGVAIPVS